MTLVVDTALLRLKERDLPWRILRKALRFIGLQYDIEIAIDYGIRMRLDPKQRLTSLIWSSDFERTERQFLSDFLKPGDIFVDVGSNNGLFALTAGRLLVGTGQVLAFEPCSEAYQRLSNNVVLNGLENIELHKLALSDCPGEFTMTTSLDGFDAWNSLATPQAGSEFGEETVKCTTWDDFATRNGLAGCIAMMKIDVEGWETRVLSGAAETLSREDAPLLQVEFTERNCLSAKVTCEELYRSLEELGYTMYTYDADSRKLIHDPIRSSYPYCNLFCVKNLEKATARLSNCNAA
jgi:FkbM family methyltransferase